MERFHTGIAAFPTSILPRYAECSPEIAPSSGNREKHLLACQEDAVCLLGALLDSYNLGCKALAASLIGSIRELCPKTRIRLLYPEQRSGTRTVRTADGIVRVELVHYRLSPRARLSEQAIVLLGAAALYRLAPHKGFRRAILRRFPPLRVIAESRVIADIRGGDSFSDVYGVGRLLYGLLPVLMVRLLGKRIVFLPQTYGPFRKRLSQALARVTLGAADVIYARDRESIGRLRELGTDRFKAPVRFCPDTAFLLEPVRPSGRHLPLPVEGMRAAPLIGLNVSGLLFQGREGDGGGKSFGLRHDYRELAGQLIETLLWRTDGDILLVPHVFGGPESDVTACEALYREWSGSPRLFRLQGEYDQHEIKWIIGRCDFFIGSRMHACIAALSQQVPAVGIAYSTKFSGVFDTVSCADAVIDTRHREPGEILEQATEWYWNRDVLRERLADRVPRVQELVRSELRNAWLV